MERLAATETLRPVARTLRMLGVASGDLSAFFKLAKITHGIVRGETLVSPVRAGKHLTMLLGGLACTSTRHEDGSRRIYAFRHPGDFVCLHRYVFPQSDEELEVEALTNCSIATIDYQSADQIVERHPALGRALWLAAMIEANIAQTRLAAMRWPAMRRVAHLLCEQLARRRTCGIDNDVISISQIEVADATGLSVVHTNRVFQDLRKLGVLSKKRQTVGVVNKERLQELAEFDARYLDADEYLSRWSVRLLASGLSCALVFGDLRLMGGGITRLEYLAIQASHALEASLCLLV
jgi:CRP-like cAMP-binding protein